jgi:hypothetical protein
MLTQVALETHALFSTESPHLDVVLVKPQNPTLGVIVVIVLHKHPHQRGGFRHHKTRATGSHTEKTDGTRNLALNHKT